MQSIYIHIPFCTNICSYCDFSKMYYNYKFVNKYLDSLSKEIKERYHGEKVKTIYIGGGTPSSLTIRELEKLFNIINIFNLEEDVEFTMEANVENLEKEKIILMKKNKVNRISLGVQTFNTKNLKKLNRHHNKNQVIKKIKELKENKITNINIDLIYGIDENKETLKKDIDTFLKLDIPHISCYSLIIENNTILKLNNTSYIDEEIEYEMYKYIEKTLKDHNYIHYEISNYAKEGYYSKHNLVYWNNQDYLGFGLSSVSYINNYRITNTKNLTKYIDGNYIKSIVYEKEEEKMDNEIMLALRKIEGLNLKQFNKKYQKEFKDIYDIDWLIKEHYLIETENHIRINKKYIYISNEIINKIIRRKN